MLRLAFAFVTLSIGAMACHRAPARIAEVAGSGSVDVPLFALSGRVTVEATGLGIAGAVVDLAEFPGRQAVTDTAGRYDFAAIPQGAYVVRVRRLGYYIERRELAVDCPVTIVDRTGRPLTSTPKCAPMPQVLNFGLREHVQRQ